MSASKAAAVIRCMSEHGKHDPLFLAYVAAKVTR